MTTGSQAVDGQEVPTAFAEAWAAVFIDIYDKLKQRGELPPDDAQLPTSDAESEQGGSQCPST